MIGRDFEWLAERARSGDPAHHAYLLGEVYPGERADLVRELRVALAGCPDTRTDKFAAMMQEAVNLNALPVLRAVVSLWRGAYRDLLNHLGTTNASSAPPDESTPLNEEERARLMAFKRGLKRR